MKKEKLIKILKELIPYLIIILVVVLLRTFIITPAIVDGNSMKPTLDDNNIVLLNKLDYKVNNVQRFDIVVVRFGKEKLIKRVIGLPGEYVKYKDGDLYINDEIIVERFKHKKTADFKLSYLNYTTIPGDKYFVVGDNRDNSVDSRMIGLIDEDDIMGIVSTRLFPFTKFGSVK